MDQIRNIPKSKEKEERKEWTITAKVIGAGIRRLRLAHGETQQYLGECIGYGATTIANYESGYRMPDLETFLRIAKHYNAALEDFLEEDPLPKGQQLEAQPEQSDTDSEA